MSVILFLLLLLPSVLPAGSLQTRFTTVTLADVPVGQPVALYLPEIGYYGVRNASERPLRVRFTPVVPEYCEPTTGGVRYAAISALDWVRVEPAAITIPPNSEGETLVTLTVSNAPAFVGRHYEFWLRAEAAQGQAGVALLSRVRFNTVAAELLLEDPAFWAEIGREPQGLPLLTTMPVYTENPNEVMSLVQGNVALAVIISLRHIFTVSPREMERFGDIASRLANHIRKTTQDTLAMRTCDEVFLLTATYANSFFTKASRVVARECGSAGTVSLQDVWRGASRLGRWRLRRAIRSLERGIAVNSFNSIAAQVVGDLLVASGSVQEGLVHLRRAHELHPQCGAALSASGVLLKAGDLKTAIRLLEEMVAVSPDNAAALANLSVCHLIAGNYTNAGVVAERALLADPEEGPAKVVQVLVRAAGSGVVLPRTWDEYDKLFRKDGP